MDEMHGIGGRKENRAGAIPPRAITDEARTGAESKFDELYHRHRDAVYAYFYSRTGRREVALDLLQELFLRVWQHLALLGRQTADQQRYWIFAVARNLVADHFRRERSATAWRRANLREPAAVHLLETQEGNPAARAELQEELAELDQALKRLPVELRTVLFMRYLGNMTSNEIGNILGQPAGTVRYHLSRARRELARQLNRGAIGLTSAAGYNQKGSGGAGRGGGTDDGTDE